MEKYTWSDFKKEIAEAMMERVYKKWMDGKKIGKFDKALFYVGKAVRETEIYSWHPALETVGRKRRIESALEMLEGIR